VKTAEAGALLNEYDLVSRVGQTHLFPQKAPQKAALPSWLKSNSNALRAHLSCFWFWVTGVAIKWKSLNKKTDYLKMLSS